MKATLINLQEFYIKPIYLIEMSVTKSQAVRSDKVICCFNCVALKLYYTYKFVDSDMFLVLTLLDYRVYAG